MSLAAKPAGRRDADGGPWQSHGAAVATRYPRSTAARVVERALGVRFEGLTLTAADRHVISALSLRIAADLARSIETSIGLERDDVAASHASDTDPWGPLGGVTVMVGDVRGPLLCAAVPLETVAAICKSGLGPPRRSAAPLADPRKAIGSTLVRVDATLGRAHLKLAELRALAPGDIVVLDSGVDGGIELTLSDADTSVAHAKLSEHQGRLALTLQPHPN